jgi:hypothetical protein
MPRMRRTVLAVCAAASLLVVIPAQAGMTLPSQFARQIRAINAAPHAPAVLLPSSMALDGKHLYPGGGPSGFSWDIRVGAVKNCDGADACFIANFNAYRAKSVFGTPVKVKGASKAGFHPLSCGASCSPPQIQYLVNGFVYTIQANLRRTSQTDRAALISAAQAAISAGPR